MKLKYKLTYDGDYSHITIPELEGESVSCHPVENYSDERYLDIQHFCFSAHFNPYDSNIFTMIDIQKEGGNDQSARATSYYERLTREEADGIIGEIIRTTLGIENFELDTDSEDLIEENEDFEDEEEKDDDEIESDIEDLLDEAEDDFSDLVDYLEKYADSYCGDIYEYAFREAIRQGKADYVEEHADDFDLNDTDGYSSFIYEAEDDEIVEILMNHGAFRSPDYYEDYKFSMESVNGTIINFDSDFQREVFEKYLETYGLSEEKIIDYLTSGKECENEDFDRDIEDDMSSLGVKVEEGELCFESMWGEGGFGAKELLEELGWGCEFEGDSWKLETAGYYYIE